MRKYIYLVLTLICNCIINVAYANNNCKPAVLTKIEQGNLGAVKALITSKISANRVYTCHKNSLLTPTHRTPLTTATSSDQYGITKYLLSEGADPNKSGEFGRLPIELTNEINIIKLLIRHGAKISIIDNQGWYPIASAAGMGKLEITKYLLSEGANVNSKNKGSLWTPLMTALRGGADYELIKFLVHNGADINAKTTNGKTPLMFAVNHGSLKAAEYLIKKGANVNAYSNDGWTVLMYAVNQGNGHMFSENKNKLRIVESLVEHGADVNVTAEHGLTTALRLSYGSMYSFEISNYLKQKGA